MKGLNTKKGIGLMEVIVALTIISMSLVGLFASFSFYLRTSFQNVNKVQALFLAEEGLEAVRFLRDKGWSQTIATLDTDTHYFLVYSTSSGWNVDVSKNLIDEKFTRSFLVQDVYRDSASNKIIDSEDPNAIFDLETKKIVVSVGFKENEDFVVLNGYITNIFNE